MCRSYGRPYIQFQIAQILLRTTLKLRQLYPKHTSNILSDIFILVSSGYKISKGQCVVSAIVETSPAGNDNQNFQQDYTLFKIWYPQRKRYHVESGNPQRLNFLSNIDTLYHISNN